MAIGLKNFPNIIPSDTDYLDGRIKDNPGDGSGTPVNQLTNADIQEFFAKLMRLSGLTPNGLFDNEYSGHQYIDALKTLIYDSGTFVNLTLNSGYTGNVTAPAYRKDNHGNVTITGDVSIASPAGNVIGTLPTGFRPTTQQVKIVGGAGAGAADGIWILIINISGSIQIVDSTGATLSSKYSRLNCTFNVID